MDIKYHNNRFYGLKNYNMDNITEVDIIKQSRKRGPKSQFFIMQQLPRDEYNMEEYVSYGTPTKDQKEININYYYNIYINKPLGEKEFPNIGGELMDEERDKTWELVKNCQDLLAKNTRERLETVLNALVEERMKRLSVDKLKAIFSLYSEGLLETDDVLRLGNIDFYQFREYLNDHNIPYRYEDNYNESLDDYKDLL